MALAKPVMGTRVPAPACLASLSKRPRPVSRAAKKMRVTDTAVPASSPESPRLSYRLRSTCPKVQMAPPTKKAHSMSRTRGEGRAWA